jgi:hypothetical protein
MPKWDSNPRSQCWSGRRQCSNIWNTVVKLVLKHPVQLIHTYAPSTQFIQLLSCIFRSCSTSSRLLFWEIRDSIPQIRYTSTSTRSAVGICCADHATSLYPQKLALTSPTNGDRSVGTVRSRTKATEVSLKVMQYRCADMGSHPKSS